LRVRAAERGRSMEAEVREILTSAVGGRRQPRGLGSVIRDRFAALGGVDLPIPSREDAPRVAEVS